ncbi:hypothetical protein Q3G72_011756 [Acer saccharum]|nr:hypothetical protein Q3G72_011756 [Acer saccharum]
MSTVQKNIHKVFAAPHLCPYWIPPALGMLKMNCAVSFDRQHDRTGIGVLVRDADGEVIGCCSQRLDFNMSVKAANLLAVQKGIRFGVDFGFLLCAIELDNVDVIDWINKGSHLDSEFGAVILELNKLTEGPQGLMFRFIPKSANMAALGLSSIAFDIYDDTFWLDEFPICIDRVIDSEKPS